MLTSAQMTHEDEAARRQLGLRASDAEKSRWQGAASRAGKSLASWVRDALDEASAGGAANVTPQRDPEFQAALEDLRFAMGIRDPAEVVRMCVLASHRRWRAGQAPWFSPDAPPPVSVEVPIKKPRR